MATTSTPPQTVDKPLTNLPKSRKAAMVVQLLLTEGSDLPLADLPEDVQIHLTKELGQLKVIDKATLDSVAEEFAREVDSIGMTAPGSMEAALKSLDGRISQTATARLRDEFAANETTDPWSLLLDLEPEDYLPIANAESPEVFAIVLSKLPTSKAATLLGLMPGDQARRIAFAISKTNGIHPDAIVRIGAGLAKNYCNTSINAFSVTPEERIGSILNSSPAATRDQLLEGIMSEDPVFGEGVRKAVFTFEDIPARLAEMDVPKVLRDIDQGDLVKALAFGIETGGQLTLAANHLLENMSSRMADNLREEMSEVGKIKLSDGELAQTAVVAAIRAAADAGAITLIFEDDDDA